MEEQNLRLLEKQLTDFISWLGENRPYHEGTLYVDMKDYIARLKSVNGKSDDIKK
jgi:hypothetical protein